MYTLNKFVTCDEMAAAFNLLEDFGLPFQKLLNVEMKAGKAVMKFPKQESLFGDIIGDIKSESKSYVRWFSYSSKNA